MGVFYTDFVLRHLGSTMGRVWPVVWEGFGSWSVGGGGAEFYPDPPVRRFDLDGIWSSGTYERVVVLLRF